MNDFQQKLLDLSNKMNKASQRVCQSEVVSSLDIDVLRQRMREMYDFLLTEDYNCVKQEEIKQEEKPIVEEKPEIIIEKEPIIEIVEEEPIIEPIIEPVEELEEEEETVEEEKPVVKEEPIVKEVKEEVKSTSSVLEYLHKNIMKDDEPKKEKKEEYTTLDLFQAPPSIAERFENKTKSDLRTSIGVGEKFMFINDLFSGNLTEYTHFINLLNEATSLELSLIIIEENRNKRKWIKNSLAYTTLENLVEKRFK